MRLTAVSYDPLNHSLPLFLYLFLCPPPTPQPHTNILSLSLSPHTHTHTHTAGYRLFFSAKTRDTASRKRPRDSDIANTPSTHPQTKESEKEGEKEKEEGEGKVDEGDMNVEDTLYNPEFFEIIQGPVVSILSLSHLKANCLEEHRPTFVVVYEPSLELTR